MASRLPSQPTTARRGVPRVEDARAGDEPFLGDVADENDAEAALLGEADELLRRGAYLAHRTGRAVERVDIHGLDRIDDDDIGRLGMVERGDDIADAGGGGELHRRAGDGESRRAQPHLV